MRTLRVAIIEDSLLLREGLVLFTEAMGHTVVAAWPDAARLEDVADTIAIDVLITDVRLPPGFRDEGILAARRLRQRRPEIAILVLSQYVESVYVRELVASERGGIGYLLKDRITAIADRLSVGLGAVEKHVGNIFAKLGLEDLSSGENRRVRAVIAWLQRPV